MSSIDRESIVTEVTLKGVPLGAEKKNCFNVLKYIIDDIPASCVVMVIFPENTPVSTVTADTLHEYM